MMFVKGIIIHDSSGFGFTVSAGISNTEEWREVRETKDRYAPERFFIGQPEGVGSAPNEPGIFDHIDPYFGIAGLIAVGILKQTPYGKAAWFIGALISTLNYGAATQGSPIRDIHGPKNFQATAEERAAQHGVVF